MPFKYLHRPEMNKTKKGLAFLVFIIAIGLVTTYLVSLNQSQSNSSPKNTPTPSAAPQTGNITVSGLITVHGLTIPPTEVAFINTETHEVYKAPINQANLSYIISLPINQTYGIEGDWNGRTFNATGIPMGAITMRLDNGSPILNLNNANSSITQNLVVGQ
jgi:hypothetical protein